MNSFCMARRGAASLAVALLLLGGFRKLRTTHLRHEVFALITVNGERRWLSYWNPEMLSDTQERGNIFRTRGEARQETIWIVVGYSRAVGRVSYARLVGESNAVLIDVVWTHSNSGGTDVSVGHAPGALRPAGNTLSEGLLDSAHYSGMIAEWRARAAKALPTEHSSQ